MAVLSFTVACWVLSSYSLFRYLGLTLRQKIVGWICFVIAFAFTVARRFSSYEIFHGHWSASFLWDAGALLFLLIAFGIINLFVGRDNGTANTPVTVESEAPDHVFHVE
jgi:hypothetical protein